MRISEAVLFHTWHLSHDFDRSQCHWHGKNSVTFPDPLSVIWFLRLNKLTDIFPESIDIYFGVRTCHTHSTRIQSTHSDGHWIESISIDCYVSEGSGNGKEGDAHADSPSTELLCAKKWNAQFQSQCEQTHRVISLSRFNGVSVFVCSVDNGHRPHAFLLECCHLENVFARNEYVEFNSI